MYNPANFRLKNLTDMTFFLTTVIFILLAVLIIGYGRPADMPPFIIPPMPKPEPKPVEPPKDAKGAPKAKK